MKNSADLGGCYPPRPSASVDNTLLYLQNSSYPTQPHSIIAKYTMATKPIKFLELHYTMTQFLIILYIDLGQPKSVAPGPGCSEPAR